VDVFLDRLDARVCEQLVRCGANADAARWLAPAAGCDEPVSSTVYESALLLVFPGQGAEGESCRASTDCAGDARCVAPNCNSSDGCCVGECRRFLRDVTEGESCESGECARGLSCYRIVTFDGESDEFGRCVRRAPPRRTP
jgi:hypothetical protein